MARTNRVLTSEGGGQVLETIDAPTDSIELSINAKGEPQWCVKAYGNGHEEVAAKLAELRALAEKHAAEIRAAKGP